MITPRDISLRRTTVPNRRLSMLTLRCVTSLSMRAAMAAGALFLLSPPELVAADDAVPALPWRFEFGKAADHRGFVAVTPDLVFSSDRGFGYEAGASLTRAERSTNSGEPFYFSARV